MMNVVIRNLTLFVVTSGVGMSMHISGSFFLTASII